MGAAWRGFGAGAREMEPQEIDDPRITEVAGDDTHHGAAQGPGG
jgi:hypothetical protein